MGLPVISFAASAGDDKRLDWNEEDYNGLFVTKALKRKPFSGRCSVRISGQPVGVRSGEREVALRWFANVAHRYLFDSKIQTPVALIPIPNGGAIDIRASCDTSAQAAELANSLAKDAYVLDVLRWQSPIPQGDHPAKHYFEQAIVHDNPLTASPRKTTVLVDEVFTDGSVIRGVAARLAEKGIKVDLVLCAAHDAATRAREVFTAHKHSVDDGL
ncbi:MAG: hypothetical protein ACAI38_17890 [Myxococcota bacterium]|nr:hypothetical protein [Myxococcota bacterium]